MSAALLARRLAEVGATAGSQISLDGCAAAVMSQRGTTCGVPSAKSAAAREPTESSPAIGGGVEPGTVWKSAAACEPAES